MPSGTLSAKHLQKIAGTSDERQLFPLGPGAVLCRRQLRSARGRWPTSVFRCVLGFLVLIALYLALYLALNLALHLCISPICTPSIDFFRQFSCAIRLVCFQIGFLQVVFFLVVFPKEILLILSCLWAHRHIPRKPWE